MSLCFLTNFSHWLLFYIIGQQHFGILFHFKKKARLGEGGAHRQTVWVRRELLQIIHLLVSFSTLILCFWDHKMDLFNNTIYNLSTSLHKMKPNVLVTFISYILIWKNVTRSFFQIFSKNNYDFWKISKWKLKLFLCH